MKKKCCIWITAAIAATIVVAAVAVTLVVVLSRHSSDVNSAGTSLDDSISQNATFPNGSYTVSAQALQPGTPAMAPRELNASTLGQLGIRVDNSSFVAETGRLSFFYICLPPSASNRQIRSPAEEVSNNSDIGNIGVHFGDAHTINVVPLSLASVPRSGLRLVGRLPDSSAVYELQVRMSESMCSGTSRGACTVISWRPYSISSDVTVGEGGDFSTSLPVACGSQCDAASDSPCASSSCQACDGQQVAGADTPVTRRYNMGATSGTLIFQYETYVVKDRVTVVYENQDKLDSGCVGTDGTRTAKISFSGSSQELRVDVEPNCEGTTGTKWWFELPCLSAATATATETPTSTPTCSPSSNSAQCGMCRLREYGGFTRFHDYICCNNCDEQNPSCNGHTYQGGSNENYCGTCGEFTGGGIFSNEFRCGGCAGQQAAENYCNQGYWITKPFFCGVWRRCMTAQCQQAAKYYEQNPTRRLDATMQGAVGPLCGDSICNPGETTTCPQDCCYQINPTMCDAPPNTQICLGACCSEPTCCSSAGSTQTP